jgi:serine/threonine-protein kinase RsbW
MKKRKEISINSTEEEMYLVEQFVEQISDEYLLGDDYFGNLMVAVTEAVRNAVIHGNGGDPKKKVHIQLESGKNGLWITVMDEGAGFDFEHYLAMDYISSPDMAARRGLFLIRSLADDVRFQEKGRIIRLLFRINGIDEHVVEHRQQSLYQYFRMGLPAQLEN